MASFDGKRVIAVGLNGIVLTSSNAGKIIIVQILFRLLSPEPQVVYVSFTECYHSSSSLHLNLHADRTNLGLSKTGRNIFKY